MVTLMRNILKIKKKIKECQEVGCTERLWLVVCPNCKGAFCEIHEHSDLISDDCAAVKAQKDSDFQKWLKVKFYWCLIAATLILWGVLISFVIYVESTR